jgi:type III restriction enzyme
MELKQFQRDVIADLARFLELLDETGNPAEAYKRRWTDRGVTVGFGGMPAYKDFPRGVPNVCFKVPTGGGKTFIASCALRPIFDSMPREKARAVVWLVPSDSILTQTLANLSNPEHPYRRRLDSDFGGRAEVYSKAQLLNGQNFTPSSIASQLSIFVLSYDSFRTNKKEGRKAYQENGALAGFAAYQNPSELLDGADETALIQVIRSLNPVVVVDESHHAATPLSKEMLAAFNPSFVLDLTATPKSESNIISYADAMRLKRENMVKLPVIVNNLRTKTHVFAEAIWVRRQLEEAAVAERAATGNYIRPIVLFQAEPKSNDDATTFDKVKKSLLALDVPENQIAVKTADVNELRGVDLLSENCPVRYIITVNALKEGWDCPFAYVLATIANRTSSVDVEQILGRVLRLPYTRKNKDDVLNISYALTSSSDFHATLNRVVAGLNGAGFSESDYRLGEDTSLKTPPAKVCQLPIFPPDEKDDEIDPDAARELLAGHDESQKAEGATNLLAAAAEQSAEYERTLSGSEQSIFDSIPPEVRSGMKTFRMNKEFAGEASKLLLPRFVVPMHAPLFSDASTETLDAVALTKGFSLAKAATDIDFNAVEAEIAGIDIQAANAEGVLPKARKLSGADYEFFKKWFDSLPTEGRVNECKRIVKERLSKINCVADADLYGYVDRVIAGLTSNQLEDLQRFPYNYAAKIREKVESLLQAHRAETFDKWIEQGRITCERNYRLPRSLTFAAGAYSQSFSKTLYEAEESMNGLENDVAWALSGLDNIKWWHRNTDRADGFNINGYINAYPDIIAETTSGKILVIEPKGDFLANEESRAKVKIGRKWQDLAGANYRYYMIFREKHLDIEGVVRLQQFLGVVGAL